MIRKSLNLFPSHTASLFLRKSRKMPKPRFFFSWVLSRSLHGHPFFSASLFSLDIASKSYCSAHLCSGISPSLVLFVCIEW